MVTAIAPRAFIDVAFVAAQAVRLIRRIAEIYDEIRRFSGVAYVSSLQRHLATLPGVLAWAWDALRPAMVSGVIPETGWRLGGSLRLTPAAGFAVEQSIPHYSQVSNVINPANGWYPLTSLAGFAVTCAWAAAAMADTSTQVAIVFK